MWSDSYVQPLGAAIVIEMVHHTVCDSGKYCASGAFWGRTTDDTTLFENTSKHDLDRTQLAYGMLTCIYISNCDDICNEFIFLLFYRTFN
jgi:hypothetical protein